MHVEDRKRRSSGLVPNHRPTLKAPRPQTQADKLGGTRHTTQYNLTPQVLFHVRQKGFYSLFVTKEHQTKALEQFKQKSS